MRLTSTQTRDYERNGFLVIPDFLDQHECDELVVESERLVKEFEPEAVKTIFSTLDQKRNTNEYFMNSAERISYFFEPGAFDENGELRQRKELSINKIGHALHDLNPTFSRVSRKPELRTVCSDLGFTQPRLMQSMYIFKQPHIGGEVTCHQDGCFLYTEPMSVTGFWFALQDATLTNGCMYALPGGHRLPLKRRFRRDQNNGVTFEELDPTPWPVDGYIPLEAKKGTLILLHALLPHLSGPNSSDQSRHAYTVHIVEGTADYPKENWLQRSAERPALGF